ncbi:YbaN family protein [Oceanibacterium hippocampi]|uniref:Inner membrane protein YbaN n=1 Tax=Oceanibacterium hippocampi TaxID=745714 RepID=A0A1Y5TQD0_9PROT|nr:YbaN family protein [Oceanibacterium hippocampi]SLN69400.1 Inner membrane protein YbaN [Oceanibacterium hippocampi]
MHRRLYLLLGFVCVALGIAGVVLPVLPTTPFMLLALWAFARSSERLHDWLYHHPRFGPPLRRWRDHGVIPLRAKLTAIATMAASLVGLVVFSAAPPWAIASAAALMAVGATVILSRPSRVRADIGAKEN